MAELFYAELISVIVTVFMWRLFSLAASKAVFQGDVFSYLSQIVTNITAQDVLAAAGAAILSPFVLFALLFVGILAFGMCSALMWRFRGGVIPEEDVSGPPAPRLPEVQEEAEAFARSGDPEKRRLAVRSPACPLDLLWDALADGDKRVRLNALCRLVAAGAVTEGKAREIFSSWAGCHRQYAEKNFDCLLEAYLHTGQKN